MVAVDQKGAGENPREACREVSKGRGAGRRAAVAAFGSQGAEVGEEGEEELGVPAGELRDAYQQVGGGRALGTEPGAGQLARR